jgi:hypothetical protein
MSARIQTPLAIALAAFAGLSGPVRAEDATAAGLAPAQDFTAMLAQDWRPRYSDTADPVLAPIDCSVGDQECVEEHGTFIADRFLRVTQAPEGSLVMFSDGDLSATIAARKDQPSIFDVTLNGGGRATLHWGSVDCGDEEACFEISGTTDPTRLADGAYVPVVQLAPNDPGKVGNLTLQSRFGSVPANMDLAGHCYDITKMGVDTFTDQQGCGQQIFKRFSEMGPYEYSDRSFGTDQNVAIPYGWKYLPILTTFGGNRSTLQESADDVMNSHERSIGANVSVGLGPVTFSVSHNETTKSRIEDMYARKLTYSTYRYIKTDFSLVVDKANAQLAPPFYNAILEQSQRETPDFSTVIEIFGTHYAYATTMGERGRLISTISEENVSKLHDQGIDVSTTVSVGVSEGEFSASGGVSVGSKDENLQKMASTLGEDFGSYFCEGGLSCTGKDASGSVVVPVLLDLRPLSDLLAPPFFSQIDDLPTLRAAYAKALADYAFNGDPASQVPAARFLLATNGHYGCGVEASSASVGEKGNAPCTMTGITVTAPGATMTLADGPGGAALAPTGRPLLLPAASAMTLTGSAMVAHVAASCSNSAYDRNDQSLLTPAVAKGSAEVLDPMPVDGVMIELETNCGETSGDRSVKGRAFVSVRFAPVSAAQALSN